MMGSSPANALNAVHPSAYLTEVMGKIVNGHLNGRIDELLP